MNRSFLAIAPFATAAACLLTACSDEAPKSSDRKQAILNTTGAPSDAPPGMVWIPGGEFIMGAEPNPDNVMSRPTNESPPHPVYVDGFWMDETEVTNAQFREFVEASGYKTVAETPFDPADFPGVDPKDLVAAGYVFKQSERSINLQGAHHDMWWKFTPGASWKSPLGPGSNIEGKDQEPVVCMTYPDAKAYADWAGKRLPTEAEWEFATRGGFEQQKYPWGNELLPEGKYMANFWQGGFPHINTAEDGFTGLAPVKSYPPNAFGLYDMAGNVWEITNDLYDEGYYSRSPKINPPGALSSAGRSGDGEFPTRVMRGGSYVCAESYCTGYRTSARQTVDSITASCHVGFRCVREAGGDR